MYGLIGKIRARAGNREQLAGILLAGTRNLPGCHSYVIAPDALDADCLWITEVWDSRDSHDASLSLERVRDAISAGRPLIAGFEERFETEPLAESVTR